jgi:sugar transferase (PEP-CTERM/EpsH1 system associated)
MRNLLFLVHRIPFPPDKGDKIRSFNLLRQLSEKYNVHLAGFIDKKEDWDYVEDLRKYCSQVYFRPINRWKSKVSSAFSLMRGRPLSVGFYSDKALRLWVENLVREVHFDAAIAFSSSMPQFLPYEKLNGSVINADFVDLDSDKWNQYAAAVRWPLSSVYSYESKALAKWEMDTAKLVDAVTLVSNAERQLLLERFGQSVGNIEVVRNGVDTHYFDPMTECGSPYAPNTPVAVFTGAMDYFANIQGVKWFVDHVWSTVKEQLPEAEFWIVGSNPTDEVQALQSEDGVIVTGYVPDVRPYLKCARVVVVPLQLARGVQNKVLEALAMNLPVLATPQALKGLDGWLPASATSISDASTFATAAAKALKVKNHLGYGQGRDYVRKHYDWENNLAEIDRILAEAGKAKSRIHGYGPLDK